MFIDASHRFKSAPQKIVSLVPSQTELLAHLGLQNETVAITKFCVHPAAWRATKVKIGGTKQIDIDKINSLKPDLILCNKEENVQDQITTLAERYPVFMTDVDNYDSALAMIKDIGTITGKAAAAATLADEIERSFNNLSVHHSKAKTALYLIWKDPYMTVGADTFIASMMAKAGFHNYFNNCKRYPTVAVENVGSLTPDFVLLSSEPYPFKEKNISEIQALFPAAKLMLVDGEMFSWYGSRMLAAAEYFKSLHRQIATV